MSRKPRRLNLQIGDSVAYLGPRVAGVDPVTELVVTKLHRDGKVSVKVVRQDIRFTARPHDLQPLE